MSVATCITISKSVVFLFVCLFVFVAELKSSVQEQKIAQLTAALETLERQQGRGKQQPLHATAPVPAAASRSTDNYETVKLNSELARAQKATREG